MMSARRAWAGLLLACALGAGAAPRIEVQALFKDRALLLIDGKRRMLQKGETSPEGVTLLGASSRGAEIRIDGERRTLALGNRIGASFAGPREQRVRVPADADGMYKANGTINGQPVRFVLDTGSTLVSISETLATRLRLDYRERGREGESHTAAGIVRIWRIPLGRVTLGAIELTDVEAAVHEGDFPATPLLGNSFLGRIDMTRSGNAVVLSIPPSKAGSRARRRAALPGADVSLSARVGARPRAARDRPTRPARDPDVA